MTSIVRPEVGKREGRRASRGRGSMKSGAVCKTASWDLHEAQENKVEFKLRAE